MDLQSILGADFKEGMSIDEINSALSNKNLADLSTGKYANKEMTDAKEKQLNEQIKGLKSQLNSKLTDDEKAAKDLKEKDEQIAKLEEKIKQSIRSQNKSKLIASTAEMIDKLEIKADDKDFNSFIDLITLEDDTNSTTVSSYLGNLLKLAYQKGQETKTKEQIANASTFQTNGNDSKEPINIGEKIAKQNAENLKQTTNKFFK